MDLTRVSCTPHRYPRPFALRPPPLRPHRRRQALRCNFIGYALSVTMTTMQRIAEVNHAQHHLHVRNLQCTAGLANPPAGHVWLQILAPRVALRNLFWSKVLRKPNTIWACTAGPPGLAEPHLGMLERLFVQAAPTPMVKKGDSKAGGDMRAPAGSTSHAVLCCGVLVIRAGMPDAPPWSSIAVQHSRRPPNDRVNVSNTAT